MTNRADHEWIRSCLAASFEPKEYLPIDEWVDKNNFMLPSNTAEPGKYNIDRAPYQRGILRAFSPDHPAKDIVLVFGSQMGKTTVENIVMCYYISESPSPILFAFSDEANLKNYVKNKFDPMLSANPKVRGLLKSEGKSSADSLTTKQFPGGFLKFLSGKSEASMRSDSARLVMGDEVDAWGYTKGGDPKQLLTRRQNTFRETRKMGLSSTPVNDGIINSYLEESTYRKYFVPCPHCGEMMTFELDSLHWKVQEDTNIVIDAWMECPHCKGRINNEDKLEMCGKGTWVATNPKADPTYEGFYLPTFYAPVGWTTWRDMAQEYVTALTTTDGTEDEKMTTFYNTLLGQRYIKGANSQNWRLMFEKGQKSPYVRAKIPSWVNFLTTGADVQGNRIEVSVYGWGKLGHSLAIDHYEIPVEDRELEYMDSQAWGAYTESTLGAIFEREDGLKMQTVANAIDSSYRAECLYTYFLSQPKHYRDRLYLVKGRDNMSGNLSNRKFVTSEGFRDVAWYEVPVSSLKHSVFDHLNDSIEDYKGEAPPYYMEYPNDYTQEYYQQLFSEVWLCEGKKWKWKKTRERNEILDCTVYNLAMYYSLGLGRLTAEDWDGIANEQKEEANGMSRKVQPRGGRRVLSRGVE